MTNTEDLTGWRLALGMLAAVAIMVGVYVAVRVVLGWWTR